MGKIQKTFSHCCGRPPNLQDLSFYHVLIGGVSFKLLKSQKTTLETYGKLSSFIFLTLHLDVGSKGAKFCVL